MFDAELGAGSIERMAAEPGCRSGSVLRQVGELDAVVGQDGVDLIGHGFDQGLEEAGRCPGVGFLDELREGELGCPVDGHEEVEFPLFGSDLGDVDMKEADRVALELLPRRLLALDIRQAADAVALQAAMQRRTCQMRERRL